jgi:hypothetical protein
LFHLPSSIVHLQCSVLPPLADLIHLLSSMFCPPSSPYRRLLLPSSLCEGAFS